MATNKSHGLLDIQASRRRFLMGAGALGATGFLAACGDGGSASGGSGDGNPITIGYVASLTGATAAYGTQTLNALQLAAKDLNGLGGILGRQVVIKAVDNQSKPDAVPALMKQLVQDGCRIMLGASASPPTVVAATTADQIKVPLLVPMEAAASIIGDGRKYAFKLEPTMLADKGWAAASVRAVMAGAKAAGSPVRTALIVHASLGAFPEAKTAWERTLKDEFPDVRLLETISYDEASTSDYAPLVSKVQAANPDVLIFGGNPQGTFQFYPALKASGFVPRATVGVLGGNTNTKFVESAGDIAENDLAGSYWTEKLKGKEGSKFSPQKFYDDYRAAYDGQKPDGIGACYYSALAVAAEAITIAGTADDSEKIAQALRKVDFDGLGGDKNGMYIIGHGVKFDEKGLNTKAEGIVTQLQGGEFIPVYPENVATAKMVYPRPGSK
ncbi:ABC transporter substrate-binding protein [Umezawaea endophytica]|uniref:ABC transporter substrate-binding protein n=1 Tax=Umezawaea endophytica TaxID=1654476 RepID=A0A9X2VF37_9PSEU|nr:ABC transporter substrate-binding protein [Umezawaea endophytica]MCS7475476.1 ABC transporter substrate-binding protein [Umezawaea endophytica]